MVNAPADEPLADFPSFAVDYAFDDLLAWAERVLGSAITWNDRSEQHTASLVLELVDAAGARWFLKYPRDRDRFDREVAAFVTVLPSFGDQVPRLAGYDDRLQCLLLSAVPGRDARSGPAAKDPGAHRAAGAWLAKLHAVELSEPQRLAPPVSTLPERRESVIERSEEVLSRSELDLVKGSTRLLLELDDARTVACHGDFTPRNWLVEDDGALRVIDFGQCSRDHAVRDLSRLALRHWPGNPALRAAFFDGYGRRLDTSERQLLSGFLVLLVAQNIAREFNRSDLRAVKRWRRVLARLDSSSA